MEADFNGFRWFFLKYNLVLVVIVWVDGWNDDDVGWFGALFCELYFAEEDPKGIIFIFQLFEADGCCIGRRLEFVLMQLP